jgi:DNA-binding FadR family transcriptional regulator
MKSVVKFFPVTAGRASEDVALQIEAAIFDRKIKPGERLPSERELQVQFGTGRGVIREALKTLKQKSLIEIKKGSKGGAYIKEVEVSYVGESLALFIRQQSSSPRDLIEFRESMDRTITTLAISRATAEEKQGLLDKTVAFENLLRQDTPDMDVLGELDRELNIMLAKMTRNPIFEWIMQAIQLGFSSHDFTLYQRMHYRKKTITNWRNTALAIAEGEPLKALSYISYHYAMLLQLLDEMEKEENPAKERVE